MPARCACAAALLLVLISCAAYGQTTMQACSALPADTVLPGFPLLRVLVDNRPPPLSIFLSNFPLDLSVRDTPFLMTPGSEVRTLVNGVKQPGTYVVEFDGTGLASGIYFCRLIAGPYAKTISMVLLR